jgi:hypothetical protein
MAAVALGCLVAGCRAQDEDDGSGREEEEPAGCKSCLDYVGKERQKGPIPRVPDETGGQAACKDHEISSILLTKRDLVPRGPDWKGADVGYICSHFCMEVRTA